jgi:hypothetical protein
MTFLDEDSSASVALETNAKGAKGAQRAFAFLTPHPAPQRPVP